MQGAHLSCSSYRRQLVNGRSSPLKGSQKMLHKCPQPQHAHKRYIHLTGFKLKQKKPTSKVSFIEQSEILKYLPRAAHGLKNDPLGVLHWLAKELLTRSWQRLWFYHDFDLCHARLLDEYLLKSPHFDTLGWVITSRHVLQKYSLGIS